MSDPAQYNHATLLSPAACHGPRASIAWGTRQPADSASTSTRLLFALLDVLSSPDYLADAAHQDGPYFKLPADGLANWTFHVRFKKDDLKKLLSAYGLSALHDIVTEMRIVVRTMSESLSDHPSGPLITYVKKHGGIEDEDFEEMIPVYRHVHKYEIHVIAKGYGHNLRPYTYKENGEEGERTLETGFSLQWLAYDTAYDWKQIASTLELEAASLFNNNGVPVELEFEEGVNGKEERKGELDADQFLGFLGGGWSKYMVNRMVGFAAGRRTRENPMKAQIYALIHGWDFVRGEDEGKVEGGKAKEGEAKEGEAMEGVVIDGDDGNQG